MKKYIEFIPFIGIGFGIQRTQKCKEILILVPFIIIHISIKNK